MNPVRVMHVRTSLGLYGAERVILNLARHVDPRRFEFLLLCVADQDGHGEPFVRGALAARTPVACVADRRKLDLRAIASIRRLVKEQRVQILHAHDFKADLYTLLASIGLPVKRVVSAHGTTHDSLVRRIYLYIEEHLLYRAFDAVVAVAEHMRRHLIGFLDPRRVTVIQNGVDAGLLEQASRGRGETPLPGRDSRPLFAVIGRLLPDKGHRFFLEAFADLQRTHRECAAWIVGDGPELDAIAAQVHALGLDDAVTLCGPRADMQAVYERIDCLVIPSLTEGLPMVLLEAFAWKRPVVATSVGDVPLLVQPGKSGYLVPAGDPVALADAMRALLDAPEHCRRMADAGYAIVRERFTARRMAADTEALYEQLLLA